MTIEEALVTRLAANSGVSALVGQRIYYIGKSSQSVAFPYIVLQTIDDLPSHSHGGDSSLHTVRVQISSFDDSYLGAKALDAAIFASLDSFVGIMSSGPYVGKCHKDISIDLANDNDPNISGVSSDYLIMYNP